MNSKNLLPTSPFLKKILEDVLHKNKGTIPQRGRFENYEAGEPIPETKVKEVLRMTVVHQAQRAD